MSELPVQPDINAGEASPDEVQVIPALGNGDTSVGLASLEVSGQEQPPALFAQIQEPELDLDPVQETVANILLVDDTPANLRLLVEILMNQGYQVRPVTDGRLAIAAAQLHPPDLILLDIKMPVLDGYGVCEVLKADERTRDVPIIFLTVLDDPVDKAKGFEMGGVDYITKPFETLELLARVKNHLRLRTLQKQLIFRNDQLQKLLVQYQITAKALRNSEAKFAKAFESSPYPVTLISLTTQRYVDANRAFLEQTGYSLDELIGKTPVDINIWVDLPQRQRLFKQFQRDGSVHGFEAQLQTKQGEVRTAILFLEVIQIGDQRYLMTIGQDVTERKLAEQQIAEQNRELSKALETLKQTQHELIQAAKMSALGSLVAGVAHEVNTPVGNAILMASTLDNATQELVEAAVDSSLSEFISQDYVEVASEACQLILTNLQRAGELVQSFKQVTVDQVSARDRPFSVKPYLEEVIMNLKPQLRTTPHRIELLGDGEYMIHSYPGALAQVVTNLVLNSLHHGFTEGGEPGVIQLDVQPEEEQCHLVYRDNGVGIHGENLERIFEPFFTTAGQRGGSGLGLHLVYNLVTQRLQGQIKVSSEPGQGVQFRISLPRELSWEE